MSGVLDHPPTLEEQVEDFAAVMDAVGSERAALFGTIDAGTIRWLSPPRTPNGLARSSRSRRHPGGSRPERTTMGWIPQS
jgi:hypothetical protein